MSEPGLYLDHSEIREGKTGELRAAMKESAELVEANEPRILSYRVYFTEDASRMSVMHFIRMHLHWNTM